MREIAYVVRGFLTVRRDSLRVPLGGSLTVRADPDSGLFSGDLTLHPATINRAVNNIEHNPSRLIFGGSGSSSGR